MSIAVPAIAVLEAVVILCLLVAMTRRRQAMALIGGANQFDALAKAGSSATPRGAIYPLTEAWVTTGGHHGTSSAHRPFETQLRTIASTRSFHRRSCERDAGMANTQRFYGDATVRRSGERYFREAVAYLPFAILMLDGRGLITMANPQTAKMFGYEGDELVGKPVDLLAPDLRSDRNVSGCTTAFGWPETHSATPSRELSARRKDGTEFRVEIGLHACRFDESVTLGFIIDRTDRNELYRARQDLMHLTRVSTMGQLASSLAHELNQPLTAILSNVQAAQRFLNADPIDLDEVREILEDIVKDDYRASEVIRRIRVLVKKGDLDVAPLDLAGMIRDVIHLVHSDAIVRGTRVTLELESGLPPVYGDKVQLQQVILNLLLNAFDAMKDVPPVDRTVLVTLRSEDHNTVCIAVHDKGHGLTADKLDKIFKPFVTSKPHGLGLGLSISRTIIDTHRGRLWAENNTDRGATFYVTLPAVNATNHAPSREAP
jgi:two-component system sensor kinase FixL